MIYAVVALAVCNVALTITYYLVAKLDYEARRTLTAAALQAKGLTDAARRAAAPTPTEHRKVVEEQAKAALDARATGAPFSAANPFGVRKPDGV